MESQAYNFLRYIRIGENCEYPRCCIMQFAKEAIEGKQPFQLRGNFKGKDSMYVPCDQCKNNDKHGFNII